MKSEPGRGMQLVREISWVAGTRRVASVVLQCGKIGCIQVKRNPGLKEKAGMDAGESASRC